MCEWLRRMASNFFAVKAPAEFRAFRACGIHPAFASMTDSHGHRPEVRSIWGELRAQVRLRMGHMTLYPLHQHFALLHTALQLPPLSPVAAWQTTTLQVTTGSVQGSGSTSSRSSMPPLVSDSDEPPRRTHLKELSDQTATLRIEYGHA